MKSIGFDPVLIDMLRSVSEFHDRWGIGRWKEGRLPPPRWMRGRAGLIAEENTEFSSAPTLEDLAEEAADVLFVAIGTLDLLPQQVVKRALRKVINKNDAKTAATHYTHPETGKVTRRSEVLPD